MREQSSETVPPERARSTTSVLPLLGLLVGVWAIVPPYINTFGDLNLEDRVEFADHVVPGVLVLAMSVLGYVLLRRPEPSPMLMFVAGAAILLAGFWMIATHAGLISQARQDMVPYGAVAWHFLPGVAVGLLGVAWTVRFWESEPSDGAKSGS